MAAGMWLLLLWAGAAEAFRSAISPHLHSAIHTSQLPSAPRVSLNSRRVTCQHQMSAFALLFDCDGVLADTERDAHRPAFNRAFKDMDISAEWGVEQYGELLKTGGGKERMAVYFNQAGWPLGADTEEAQKELLLKLHAYKTQVFNDIIGEGTVPLRPGVLRLVDEAISDNVPLAVCSTSNEKAVTNLVLTLMGPDRAKHFTIFAGDVVAKKKPAPDIYQLAATTLKLDPTSCMVIEDSEIGCKAAKAAGMSCVVTISSYTADEDFPGADKIVPDLNEGNVDLPMLKEVVNAAAV